MDKNTIIGLVLIALLLIGFSYFSRPSEEQQAAWRHYNDSITAMRQQEEALQAKTAAALANESTEVKTDSSSVFFKAAEGPEALSTIENDLMQVAFTTQGGYVRSVTLKEYKDQGGRPLVLFDNGEAMMNFIFYNSRETIQTKDYYFFPVVPADRTKNTMIMRLMSNSESYIDFVYTLRPEGYMLDFEIQAHNMGDKLSASTHYVDVEWNQRSRQHERGFTYENRLSNLMFKYVGDDTDHLSESKDDERSVPERLNWIGFKNQFFSSVMISDQFFDKSMLRSNLETQGSGFVKNYRAETATFFDPTGAKSTKMHLYFGPNHFKTLRAFDRGRTDKWELDDLVYLGWPGIRWINKWFTVNLFDWLSGMGLSMGIVLLLMTIIVKIIVYPATWKTYISSARMRLLRPQIEKINKKYPAQEDAMKKQQETMGLYSQYGVSPMGGCLPMLLQFPILMALFMFVPSAIELRQQSFLWATDLSTYDDVIRFPFSIPFLGNHLSLFCLLMTVTTIVNTKYTMSQQDMGQPQMAAMKWMSYLMPVMFLFVLNDYPAGLNYYYFISTLIGVLTFIVLRRLTNEDKLWAQMEARREKNKNKKKSGFAARLEAMQKEQERLAKERAKRQK